MRKLLPILILTALFVSCAQEVIEPEQQISGLFALDDGSCMVSDYVSFENGRWSQYSTMGTLYPFAEGKIWHTDGGRFQLVGKQNYSIRDGVLTTSGGVSGPVELKDGVLTIGSKQYVALEGFEEAPYSRIVAQNEYVFTYTDQDISIPFTVENPLPYQELTAGVQSYASGGTWITNLAVQEGKITAHISSTAEDRTGTIELSYTHAESVTVQIKQQPSTFISIPETSRTVDYTSSTQTLNYSIENPVATSSLRAYPSDSWVRNINISENQISFDVQENNTGADRSATLTLRYEGARDVTFNVLQRWSASSITLTPASKEVDYTSGTFTFNYAVTNPREGVTVTATSQANWITDVRQTGTTVSYKVAENNSTASRTGKIKLIYGSYATAEFSVTQSGKPVQSITLNKTALPLHPGNVETLVATVDPSDAALSWTSSNSAVATVSTAGKVTAVGNGSAVITASATDGSGKKATCTVTVTTLVTGVSLNKSSLNLNEGASETLTVTISPSTASNKSVTWSSTNTSAATVDQNGKVTAVSKGTATITATANDGSGKKATCAVTVKRLVSSIVLSQTSVTVYTGNTVTLTATVSPSTASDCSLTWSSSNTAKAKVSSSGIITGVSAGTATITATANDGSGKNATCSVIVKTMPAGAVDLGLSVLWATCNLGTSGFVSSPEEYGAYYAWGETTTKSNYAWSTYKFGTSSSGPFSKYNTQSYYGTVDNKTVLDPGDDVAHVKLGGNWRMPTDAEWTELRTKCTWTWTTNYNGTGVKGRIVTASNGNSIFLPAAGSRSDTNLYGAGSGGHYWSSSLCTDHPSTAWNLEFSSYPGDVSRNYGDGSRCLGFSVRPVSE